MKIKNATIQIAHAKIVTVDVETIALAKAVTKQAS